MLCGILFLATGTVSAQDVIVLNNKTADEIEAKIVEVSNDEVKYKKWAYQDGPTFSVPTGEIFVIKYQNGEKQTFSYSQTSDTGSAGSAFLRSADKPEKKQQGEFEPHVEGGIYLGYALGIGDFELDAIEVLELRVGYRFNPYFSLGGSVSNLMFYDYPKLYEDMPDSNGVIPILADARGHLPLGEKSSLYADFGIGVNIGYGACGTDFTYQVGPGIEFGKISISAIYRHYGEKAAAMSFKFGFLF